MGGALVIFNAAFMFSGFRRWSGGSCQMDLERLRFGGRLGTSRETNVMGDVVEAYVFITIGFGWLIGAIIANVRGFAVWKGALAGLFLGPFVVLIVFASPDRRCPECRSIIDKHARRCPRCTAVIGRA